MVAFTILEGITDFSRKRVVDFDQPMNFVFQFEDAASQ
jgi:hypothetical protein